MALFLLSIILNFQRMHSYIINAAIQIVPITQDRHPYEWIDEAIAIIQQSGLKYEVGAFSTVIEGSYNDVMALIQQVNEYLYSKGCPEWITNIQVQIRRNGNITAAEKTGKFK
jgi:uncharacterized protein (TIGR00106 family)